MTTRPALRGHRMATGGGSGRAWSTRFLTSDVEVTDTRLVVRAADPDAELRLVTEVESLPGGSLRLRHTVINDGADRYLVEGLDVVVPCPDDHVESLDFTGRHERERTPQRRAITDGLWVREGRQGRPGLDAAGLLITGPAGFGFAGGALLGVHVAWSGNHLLRQERNGASATTIGGGEHLLTGEMELLAGESYSTPWVFVTATARGLDGLAAALHGWQRSLPTHPGVPPVTLNVWEAVYFDHDLARLKDIADRAARVGVQRFVLDDGWFHLRKDDLAGLGDWWVDPSTWPDGLTPLIEYVTSLGMEFGLWFEPEMVNPDSDLFRSHPEWILSVPGRLPLPHRNQVVLDLSRPEVVDHLFAQMDAVLSANDISYVKWDHNRDLLEAGSGTRGGAPAVHAHTLGYYALLDRLRAAHPRVAWESCASGGGRIDLGVLSRVQRVWTSDMTDALARQQIQRWTTQVAAPEYLGAHISAPTSHQTARTLPLAFRAATALFGAFGIEWDLSEADDDALDELTGWIERYRRFQPLLHGGRVTRIDSEDPAVLLHGVVAEDGREALIAHVQMDESVSNRGVRVRIPGLVDDETYQVCWEGPVDGRRLTDTPGVDPLGPTGGVPVTGRTLAATGLWIPRRRPQTVLLAHLTAVGPR
ncbi:alpha-galactosidase [Nakamurella flava]|uniref:alpha-galactosidase n=1 Tax=Nakamurella flava TaxID=2576308 RepID=UPI0030B8EA97